MAGTPRTNFSATITKDEWSPALEQLADNLSADSMRHSFRELGGKMVASIKRHMSMQLGWADAMPYAAKPLKITARYHGRKNLVANKRNLKRISKGDKRARVTSTPQGNVVNVVDKTEVGPQTKILIDIGLLRRSWSVLKVKSDRVEVAPRTPQENAKAIFNDDRGRWSFGRNNTEEIVGRFLGFIDHEVFD